MKKGKRLWLIVRLRRFFVCLCASFPLCLRADFWDDVRIKLTWSSFFPTEEQTAGPSYITCAVCCHPWIFLFFFSSLFSFLHLQVPLVTPSPFHCLHILLYLYPYYYSFHTSHLLYPFNPQHISSPSFLTYSQITSTWNSPILWPRSLWWYVLNPHSPCLFCLHSFNILAKHPRTRSKHLHCLSLSPNPTPHTSHYTRLQLHHSHFNCLSTEQNSAPPRPFPSSSSHAYSTPLPDTLIPPPPQSPIVRPIVFSPIALICAKTQSISMSICMKWIWTYSQPNPKKTKSRELTVFPFIYFSYSTPIPSLHLSFSTTPFYSS